MAINTDALIAELDLINDPQVLFAIAEVLVHRINVWNEVYVKDTTVSWANGAGPMGRPNAVLSVNSTVVSYSHAPMDFYIKVVVR